MAEEAPALGITIVMLGVRELARSLEFYRDRLSLPVSWASDELAFVKAGAVMLGLRQAPDQAGAREDGRMELVFTVDDVDQAYAWLRERGVVFRIAPRIVTAGKLAADFRDPDGHVLSIFGPRRADVRAGGETG